MSTQFFWDDLLEYVNLYVTTTFDLLLEQALNEERFGGAPKSATLAYSPNNVQDLPCEMANLDRPTVYHLFGRIWREQRLSPQQSERKIAWRTCGREQSF
jgi:hypothetical protein